MKKLASVALLLALTAPAAAAEPAMETGNDWLKLCGKPPNTKTAQIYIARCY